MSDWARNSALASARATWCYSRRVRKPLCKPYQAELSMAPRQAEELNRFIQAHETELEKRIKKAEKSEGDKLSMQLLIARQTEMEQSLRFVEQAFLEPRLGSASQRELEAADWLCVEGFREFVTDETRPVGPLVAIDSRRSPAVWEPGATLPLPSLFQWQPESINRVADPDPASRELSRFPLICMSSSMARSPELYPLLSHEVGHAVDSVQNLSPTILQDLASAPRREYWEAWMREMVADAIGLALSGEAYALALASYVRFMKVSDNHTTSSRYPGITLRLAMLGDAISELGRQGSRIAGLLSEGPMSGQLGPQLRNSFQKYVFPVLYRRIIPAEATWKTEQEEIEAQAIRVQTARPERKKLHAPDDTFFRLIPSVVALAHLENNSIDTLEVFRDLQQNITSPNWVKCESTWKFIETFKPALRHTFLASDGQTKVPPEELLISHQHIAFVAATNGQLAKGLTTAFEKRNQATWKQLEFFFGSDALLQQVVRDGARVEDLIAERDRAREEIRDLLRKRYADEWAIYSFDTPLVFASYWDWDEPGGRIHVSAQLLGSDLRRCPSLDHIWYDEVPSAAYEKYRVHLVELRRARRLEAGQENWIPSYGRAPQTTSISTQASSELT